jgi:hypothetical protein
MFVLFLLLFFDQSGILRMYRHDSSKSGKKRGDGIQGFKSQCQVCHDIGDTYIDRSRAARPFSSHNKLICIITF